MNTNFKTWGLLGVAVFLALGAGFLVMRYLDGAEASMREALLASETDERLVSVVVSKVPVKAGDIIGLANMEIDDIPIRFLPDHAIIPEQFKKYEGKIILESMSPGKPLLMSYVSGLTGAETFSTLLKEGERAVTLPIDSLNSHEGMLAVGDYVDIVVLLKKKKDEETQAAKGNDFLSLLTRVKILATGATTPNTKIYKGQRGHYEDGYGSITFAVDVKDIPSILTAKNLGKLYYLLRHPEDELKPKFGADMDLLAIESEQPRSIQIIQSGQTKQGYLVATTQEVATPITPLNKSNSGEKGRRYQKFQVISDDDF